MTANNSLHLILSSLHTLLSVEGFDILSKHSYARTICNDDLLQYLTFDYSDNWRTISGKFGVYNDEVQRFSKEMLVKYEDAGYESVFRDNQSCFLSWPISWHKTAWLPEYWNISIDKLLHCIDSGSPINLDMVFKIFNELQSLPDFYQYLSSDRIESEWRRSNSALRISTLVGLGSKLKVPEQTILKDSLRHISHGMRTPPPIFVQNVMSEAKLWWPTAVTSH